MFILVCRYNRVFAYPGDDVTLTSHLSPETSAVGMEIRWFRGIECIFLYKDGQVTVGKAYEGRVSLFSEELPRGNVSLLLREVGQADTGIYSCQVITGENRENRAEKTIHLYMSGTETLSPDRWGLKIAEQDSLDMEESVHSLEMKKVLQKKDRELQDKMKELESMAEELTRMRSLVQDRESDLENMRKEANNKDVYLSNNASDLQGCKRELQMLAQKLQEKNNESQELLAELQARTRGVQELTLVLQKKEQELEEEKKLREEREKLLHTENGGSANMENVPNGPLFSELVEKSQEMLSEIYQNPKDQQEAIERWIYKKRSERRLREEEEKTEALEKEFLSYFLIIKGKIEEEHKKIVTTSKMIADFEKVLEHVATDEERGELEVQLKEAIKRRREGEGEIERLTKEIDKQKSTIEEKHRQEVEEIREKYEIVSRIEAETNLLKIILPDVQTYFRNLTSQLQRIFTKQMEGMDKGTVLAASGEADRVENSEDLNEKESASEMLEIGGQKIDEVMQISNSHENNNCVETLVHTKTQADPSLEREINKEIQKIKTSDSENDTFELEEQYDMVNGMMSMMTRGQEKEVQAEIEKQEKAGELRELDEEEEEDVDYTQ